MGLRTPDTPHPPTPPPRTPSPTALSLITRTHKSLRMHLLLTTVSDKSGDRDGDCGLARESKVATSLQNITFNLLLRVAHSSPKLAKFLESSPNFRIGEKREILVRGRREGVCTLKKGDTSKNTEG